MNTLWDVFLAPSLAGLLKPGGSDPLLSALLIMLVIVLIALIGWHLVEKYDTKPQALEVAKLLTRQALKRQGSMRQGASELKPELSFSYDNVTIAVSIREGDESVPRVTYATVQTTFFPEQKFRISSRGYKGLISFSRLRGLASDLDSKFKLEGNDAAFLNSLLTREIQNDLLQYEQATEVRFGTRRGVRNDPKPNPGRLSVTTDGFKFEERDYDRLIKTALMFYERLKIMALVP